jgi:hypothetical protein
MHCPAREVLGLVGLALARLRGAGVGLISHHGNLLVSLPVSVRGAGRQLALTAASGASG